MLKTDKLESELEFYVRRLHQRSRDQLRDF